MSDNKNSNKSLNIEETAELLGAEKPRDLSQVHLDPIGMQALAARVSRRLSTKRGRPTDPSWVMVRKIPMKRETWDSLRDIAKETSPTVAPGQMGAVALEVGLGILLERRRGHMSKEVTFVAAKLEIRDESWKEARQLCPTINEERFW
jgi:hypothetical protein